MKITKRQLRQIIKEEKTKLQENAAERAIGLYANQSLIGKLTSAMNELEGQVYDDALEDFADDENEASEQARMVLVRVIANWMGSAGYLDVEDALRRIETYDNRGF